MNPNDLIDSIVDAIDYAEIAQDLNGLIKARRLLNNDLRQAIDLYVQEEVAKAVQVLSEQVLAEQDLIPTEEPAPQGPLFALQRVAA